METFLNIVIFIAFSAITIMFLTYISTDLISFFNYYDPLQFEKEQLKLIDNCHKLGGKVTYNEFNKFSSCLEK